MDLWVYIISTYQTLHPHHTICSSQLWCMDAFPLTSATASTNLSFPSGLNRLCFASPSLSSFYFPIDQADLWLATNNSHKKMDDVFHDDWLATRLLTSSLYWNPEQQATCTYLWQHGIKELQSEAKRFPMGNSWEGKEALRFSLQHNIFCIWQWDSQVNLLGALSPQHLRLAAACQRVKTTSYQTNKQKKNACIRGNDLKKKTRIPNLQ